jgi:hypothetical protein
MNGYLARLMEQSAVKIASSEADPKIQSSVPGNAAVAPTSEIVEEETLREAPVSQPPVLPVVRAGDPQSVTAGSQANTAPAEPLSYGEATPQPELPRLPQSIERAVPSATAAIPFVSIGPANPSATPNEQMPAEETHPSVSAVREEIPGSTQSAQEIVHEVMAWVMDTKSPATDVESTNQAARIGPVVGNTSARAASDSQRESRKRSSSGADESGRVDRVESSAFHSAEAHSSARPTSWPEPWSVQIDSIHLTIEEPASKSVPPPVVPRVAPPAAASSAQFTPSQLRRHYLRPF